MTPDELRTLVREQIEWRQVFHQLVPGATTREAISEGQVCVYITQGEPEQGSHSVKLPRHRFLHVVSTKKVDVDAYGKMLQEESGRWNDLTDAERLAAGEARLGGKWQRDKLVDRLTKKRFFED